MTQSNDADTSGPHMVVDLPTVIRLRRERDEARAALEAALIDRDALRALVRAMRQHPDLRPLHD